MLMWRNWQTHWTQNPAGNHVGSSPTISTNDVSVRTFYRTERYKYHSEKDGIFLLQNYHPIRKLEKTNLTYIEPHRVIIKNN